jgi:hypothetical protein
MEGAYEQHTGKSALSSPALEEYYFLGVNLNVEAELHHLTDDLPNEATLGGLNHATFSGVIAAILSCSARRSIRSS